jgi:hypothetical protein
MPPTPLLLSSITTVYNMCHLQAMSIVGICSSTLTINCILVSQDMGQEQLASSDSYRRPLEDLISSVIDFQDNEQMFVMTDCYGAMSSKILDKWDPNH